MTVGNLVNINFETGDLSQWDASSGSPAVTATTPIEGTYSLLTSGADHVSKNFAAQAEVWFLMEVQYAAYPTGSTRNIAALRSSGGEIISIRTTTAGQVRFQHTTTNIFTTAGAWGAGVVKLLVHVKRNGPGADVYEAWVRTGTTWAVLFTTNTLTFGADFSAVRVGGLNSGHEGTHRTDWVQVGTNSTILPHDEQLTGITNRISPSRLTGRLGGLIA